MKKKRNLPFPPFVGVVRIIPTRPPRKQSIGIYEGPARGGSGRPLGRVSPPTAPHPGIFRGRAPALRCIRKCPPVDRRDSRNSDRRSESSSPAPPPVPHSLSSSSVCIAPTTISLAAAKNPRSAWMLKGRGTTVDLCIVCCVVSYSILFLCTLGRGGARDPPPKRARM